MPPGLSTRAISRKPCPPIRQMVEHPETEDRVQDPVPVGESRGITHIEANLVLGLGLEVSPGQADHPLVQVEGVQGGGVEFFLDEAGPGPPAAADLQNSGLGRNPGDALDPLDDAALDHDPHRVVDHQPFGPVEFHGFTPR